MTGEIRIGDITVGNDRPLVLIAGPCALESRAHALEMSQALVEMAGKLGLGLIYKSSFDKANRTSLGSSRGLGMAEGLEILAEVREARGCPVLTDVHEPQQCAPTAEATASALAMSPRWIGQMSPPDGSSAADDAVISEQMVRGQKVTLLEVSGTYRAGGMGPMSQATNKPGYRMLGAIIDTSQGPWFFKLTGPVATVEKWSDSWGEFVESLEISG